MKCMIIGSCSPSTDNYSLFKECCKEIAETLLTEKATLIISSLFEDSADYWIYKFFVQHSEDVELHYLDIREVRERIKEVSMPNSVLKIPYLDEKSTLDLRYAYLLCQLNALRNADIIIAVGGKENGSANMLLSFADSTKTIIPIIAFNGAARDYYEKYRYKLEYFLTEKKGVLVNGEPKEIISAFLDSNKKNGERTNLTDRPKKIFISYARENAEWADMTEIFLRRRGINLFRDESDFRPGQQVQKHIFNELHTSDVVIALWCKEYACSPWCFDEIEEALNLLDKLELWIICVDDTRIVPTRARSLHHYKVNSRQELEGQLTQLLELRNCGMM